MEAADMMLPGTIKELGNPNDNNNDGDDDGNSDAGLFNVMKRRGQRNRVACDACHTRRVKCDRAFPCTRCLSSRIPCVLTRERRKRGRISRKASTGTAVPEYAPNPSQDLRIPSNPSEAAATPTPNGSPKLPASIFQGSPGAKEVTLVSALSIGEQYSVANLQPSPHGTGNLSDDWMFGSSGFQASSYDLLGNDMSFPDGLSGPFTMLGTSDVELTRAASRSRVSQTPGPGSEHSLKYPVLQHLMPFLEPYLSRTLVYDLLELYFASAFSTLMHPVCLHIQCYVVRKAAFLCRDNPRSSSPALLASMLWVAALDDRAFALFLTPNKRRNISRFLCALTVRLLRPLIHVSLEVEGVAVGDNVGDNEYAAATAPPESRVRTHFFEEGGDDRGLVGPAGSLDDIITYIHVGSIVSASEQKAASMRWWHAAFSLAKELKLNQEVEVTPNLDTFLGGANRLFDFGETTGMGAVLNGTQDYNHTRSTLDCVCDRTRYRQHELTEEQREERRRTWWLLYIMDRHLALCYNRPLVLLDAECEGLLLPLEEGLWQAGNVHSNSPKPDGPQCPVSGENNKRRVFPDFSCNGHSIFGFFLPLMTITGELINLNQAKNHPMLGNRFQGKETWDAQVAEVLRQLDIYKTTLTTFRRQSPDGGTSEAPMLLDIPPNMVTDHQRLDANFSSYRSWHTQIVAAYGLYTFHVLHILLVGKWDPVSLLEDKDFWTSSPTFESAISHALNAVTALEEILHFDPDVSFMPYFFGIQLLQGSFILLLFVDRLQNDAGERILNACEVVIRATESCVVTLNTEYQRNFRQVMQSALAQAKGRPVNLGEIRHRRKAILALYRWTRNGTGLAL
ncbi:Fungal specific transcription factor domain containing protein [Elaphomyces granulatus]